MRARARSRDELPRRPRRLARLGRARRTRRRLGAGTARRGPGRRRLRRRGRGRGEARARALSGAGTVALLAWLAARPASEDSARAVVDRLGIRRCDPRRALVATAAAAAVLALLCLLLALAGAFDSVRAPRELTRLDGLAWAAGLSEPAVPFDGAAVASLLARAVIGAVVLELLLRGAVLPALARLIGAWPAIAATALIGAISFGALAGDGTLLLPALALGLLLGPLLVATGSIVPGAALSAGFAGAALALACGWGAAGAAATALACAALAAAPLLAAAGPLPRRGGERLPAPRAGSLATEGGQSAAEYMGVLLLVAVIVGAIAMSGARRPDRGPRGAADLPHRGRRLLRAGRARQGLPARVVDRQERRRRHGRGRQDRHREHADQAGLRRRAHGLHAAEERQRRGRADRGREGQGRQGRLRRDRVRQRRRQARGRDDLHVHRP